VDPYGYGFRAPALLVSPYAKKGFIDHTTLDFTSVLKFIENNWSLKPLAQRDARANSIANAFNFAQAPRHPAFIPATLHPPSTATHARRYIYVIYGLPLLLMALTLAYALGIKPRLRRKVGAR
jgi:phospholipase C